MKVQSYLLHPLKQLLHRIITLEHNSHVLIKCHKSNNELKGPTRLLNLPVKTISGLREISRKPCEFIIIATDIDQDFKQKFTHELVFQAFTKQELSELFAIKREKTQQNISSIGVLDCKQVQYEWNMLKQALQNKLMDNQVNLNFEFKVKKEKKQGRVLFNPFKRIKTLQFEMQKLSNLRLINKIDISGTWPEAQSGTAFGLDFSLKQSDVISINLLENDNVAASCTLLFDDTYITIYKLEAVKQGYGYGRQLLGFLVAFLIQFSQFQRIQASRNEWLENLGFTVQNNLCEIDIASQRGDLDFD
ncbi:hypothetical protein SS50377_26659 [Spironucleus salmonicida]|uniref:Uncharacterized protein n=1 Tax=Spironucleus salmonicida TaxID=348837 RepID=V6LAR3_9EUKA|nr:hypothetical protein SS50377_26659 [Spironucleus salmonicida]|eukprot:EST41502.1 Hypothetical protein SS50377_19232 [Spironucleus salmonicida]